MQNWKTTTTGILTIFVTIATAANEFINTGSVSNMAALFTALMAGIGLLTAKDAK